MGVSNHHNFEVRVLSRNFCLGEKLRQEYSPRRQTRGAENFELQSTRDTIYIELLSFFFLNYEVHIFKKFFLVFITLCNIGGGGEKLEGLSFSLKPIEFIQHTNISNSLPPPPPKKKPS